ncbi:uronyl 2-sulfotransferase-like [Neodiprion virginianus]|uniref:uronyl 2-sulfotransferase-like n=1 Tax=Neodiprion fabricii TaxID=2872261 RepID=UPI001ED8DAC0|nr:uronyl 2-sulfotransferase-like [Neodiprion fabricii]XP_046605615.1 uronyl 2-sulfotransferase-like [Neodiprion virginianus]
MRRSNTNLLTSLIACLTVAFIVFNKAIMQPEHLSSKVSLPMTTDADRYSSSLQINNSRRDYSQAHRHVTPSLAELGGRRSIPEMSENTLMLTRILGAGSELLVLILQRLQGRNAFKHIRLPSGDDNLLTTLQQELLVEDITTIIRQEAVPLTFDADVRFLNFSAFGRQAPTYISMVRDPLDPKVLRRFQKDDAAELRYCGAIAHFCGQDPRCTSENRTWAMAEAQANVERWYPVVGLLEYIGPTLKTLERSFSYFFKGATDVYSELQVKRKTDVPWKSKIQAALEGKLLIGPLAKEVEFYLWLKSRLLCPKCGNG